MIIMIIMHFIFNHAGTFFKWDLEWFKMYVTEKQAEVLGYIAQGYVPVDCRDRGLNRSSFHMEMQPYP